VGFSLLSSEGVLWTSRKKTWNQESKHYPKKIIGKRLKMSLTENKHSNYGKVLCRNEKKSIKMWLPNSNYKLDNRPHFEILEENKK
jgi:hypothetical protein